MNKNHDDSLGLLFHKAAKLRFARSKGLFCRLGLYPGQPPVLSALWKKNGCTQKELSKLLMIKPATMTVVLQRMEKAEFIERRPDPDDLRVSRVYLTDKGVSVRSQLEHAQKTLEEDMFKGFSQEEKESMRRFLQQVSDNLKQAMSRC